MISKRLKTIADNIEDNSLVIDVGCDHALLGIYLIKTKENIKVIASDINEKPLKKAYENIKKEKIDSSRITIVRADGIENINDKVDTIVIAGMGTKLILDILNKDKEKLKNVKKLVISSNNDRYNLRKNIIKLGFSICDEQIVYENKKYYPIIVFTKSNKHKRYKRYELEEGPVLILKKDEVFLKYLKEKQDKLNNINKNLSLRHEFKKIKIKRQIRNINKILKK